MFYNKKIRLMALILLLVSQGLIPVTGLANGPLPEVAGVIGLRPVEAASCVAVWVPIPPDKALSGFWWYNNDEAVAFPEILLESGTEEYPVSLQDCQVMAENVRGISSGWSETQLFTPVACLSEGLYLLFRFPEGSAYIADGASGGAALGYMTNGEGYTGWISADGQDWVPFKGDFGFALQPIFTDVTDDTVLMKSRNGNGQEQPIPGLVTALHPAAPNPFNPSTRLKISLASADQVEVVIYNIRGQRVRTLASGPFPSGEHELVWAGRDDGGHGVASGVYFVRMKAGPVVMTQRLVLVQ